MNGVTVSGGLPDINPLRSATLHIPILVNRNDTTAEIGRLNQEVARRIADRVTTLCAETPGNYNIDFVVTIQEIQ